MKKANAMICLLICSVLITGCAKTPQSNSSSTKSAATSAVSSATHSNNIVVTESETKAWDAYLTDKMNHRDIFSLLDQKSDFDIKSYLKQGKIKINYQSITWDDFDEASFNDFLDYAWRYSYLCDINNDKTQELCLLVCQGTGRFYSALFFQKVNGVFVYQNSKDGMVFPVSYQNYTHLIEVVINYNTKMPETVIEYGWNTDDYKPVKSQDIQYSYSTAKTPASIKKIIDDKYINNLTNYELSDSNIAKTEKTSENQYKVKVNDSKNNHTYIFTAQDWLTSNYTKSCWTLDFFDDFTKKFKGIAQIDNVDSDHYGCLGFQFYKDSSGIVYFLKVINDNNYFGNQYPNFIEGDYVLELYKFNKNEVVKVLDYKLSPTIKIEINNKPK